MNDNVEILRPQPRTLDRVHGDYSHLTLPQKRDMAYAKLKEAIDKGRADGEAAVRRVMNEVIDDRLVRSRAIQFVPTETGIRWNVPGGAVQDVHPHALGQFADRVHFSTKVLHELEAENAYWARELITTNLNTLYAHRPKDQDKVLVRSVGTKVRGVLSNGYRTEDSRPAIDAIFGVARDAGAVIAGGSALDTRCSFKVMLAEPVELFEGEWAVFGLDYRTSDYGHGARDLMGWVLRLICLNGASVIANYRRIHIGKRLEDEVEYSERTRKLNSAASAAAARDIAKSLLGPEAIKKQIEQVRAANAAHLDPDAAVATLKKTVNKDELKSIVDKFNSPDVELLPPGQTPWRWSNAISWLATQTADADRRLDLEKMAGDVLLGVAPVAA